MMEIVEDSNLNGYSSTAMSAMFADGYYGSSSSFSMNMDQFRIIPSVAGSGSDTYGEFTLSSKSDTIVNEPAGTAAVSYTKNYGDWSVDLEETYPWPMTDMFAVQSSYSVNAGSNAMAGAWSSGQMSGTAGYTMAVSSGGAGGAASTGFFAEEAEVSGKMSFGGSAASGGFEIDMSMSNYKNWPSVSGSGVSNFGNFEITGGAATTTDKTMSYNMNFADAGFNCDIKQTLVSGGDISVSDVEAGCSNNIGGGAFSTFSGASGAMTMSTKAASSSSTA